MNEKFKIGIDYGGTKIEGILMDQTGKEVLRKRSTYDKNYQSGLDTCLLYTSPSPRDRTRSRMPSSA